MNKNKFIKSVIAVMLGSVLGEEASIIMDHVSEHEKPLHIPETRYVTASVMPTSSISGGTTIITGVIARQIV